MKTSISKILCSFIFSFCIYSTSFSQFITLGQWQDCGSFRRVETGTQSVFLAKGEILDSFEFITWKPGLIYGTLLFKNAKKDTFSFYANNPYFLDTITHTAYEMQSFPEGDHGFVMPVNGRKTDVPETFITDSLVLHSHWLIIYNWYLDYDTMDWGICRFTGSDLNDISKKLKPEFSIFRTNWDSFQVYIETNTRLNTSHCLCPEDTSMFGRFLDWRTGETIEIFQNPIRVFYGKFNPRSARLESRHFNKNMILKRRELFVKAKQLGLLYVSFTPDFSRENYTLYYTGSEWLIPGSPGIKGAKGEPQYFSRF